MQRSPSWTWTINNLVRVLHTNASASKLTDDRYSHSARRVPHTDDATQRHRQQPGTHTHTHTDTWKAGEVKSCIRRPSLDESRSTVSAPARRLPSAHQHSLLTYLLTNITCTQIYAQCDSDVSLFHMPADFCRHLVGKTLRNVCHCDRAQIRFVGNSVIIWTFS